MNIAATLNDLRVPVESLRPYARNPRRGSVEIVRESLQRHGQYRPIVVNARTHEVLAGNHTLRAARDLGWSEIAATFVDVDDDTAARIVLVDNRSSDVAGYDTDELVQLLDSLPDLDGSGYGDDDLRRMMGELGDADTSPQLGAIEYRLIVSCDDEHHQAQWLERLQRDGLTVQAIAQ